MAETNDPWVEISKKSEEWRNRDTDKVSKTYQTTLSQIVSSSWSTSDNDTSLSQREIQERKDEFYLRLFGILANKGLLTAEEVNNLVNHPDYEIKSVETADFEPSSEFIQFDYRPHTM